MERYQKALQEILGQTGGTGFSDEQIRKFVRGKSDKEIARVMLKAGVDVNQFARALDMPVEEVRDRFAKVLPEARADNERLRVSQELQQGRLPQANQASPRQQQASPVREGRMSGGIRNLGVS
tara:strand:- start:331 stop:699 length:369 start_codon:yes stop_codon:yes gene_type:complete